MSSNYHTANSSKYLLKLHLILVCKYRKHLLIGNLNTDMKQILYEISQISNFKIETMESEKDHIHLLLDCEPTVSPSSIANRLKLISTNRIWKKHFNFLKLKFWKEQTFWSDGYFVCSTGDASTEVVKKYILSQG
jgi:putative transposase